MERLLIVVAVVVVAAVVALIARRRQPRAPLRTAYTVPDHLDRADFDRPESPWLVAVFSSPTCASCTETWEKARHLESDQVAVQQVDVAQAPELHQRYRIDAVPLIVIVDRHGTRQASFLGPPKSADLWAALADLRD